LKRTILTSVAILVFVFVLAACGGSNKEMNKLETILKNGTIIAGTSADYPPFEYVDAAGEMAGFDVDMMNEIAKQLGVKLEWVDMPFDSLIAAVQEGKIDASISAFNYSEERDQTIDFTKEYYMSEDAYIVAEGFSGQLVNPEDIASFIVGVQTGTTQDGWLTDNLVDAGKMPEENLFRYDRADQAAMDLKNGRIEVWMADYVPGQALVDQLGGLKVIYKGVLSSGPMNIIVPNGDTALAEEMNKIIVQLESEGFIKDLAIKFIGGIQ